MASPGAEQVLHSAWSCSLSRAAVRTKGRGREGEKRQGWCWSYFWLWTDAVVGLANIGPVVAKPWILRDINLGS